MTNKKRDRQEKRTGNQTFKYTDRMTEKEKKYFAKMIFESKKLFKVVLFL